MRITKDGGATHTPGNRPTGTSRRRQPPLLPNRQLDRFGGDSAAKPFEHTRSAGDWSSGPGGARRLLPEIIAAAAAAVVVKPETV